MLPSIIRIFVHIPRKMYYDIFKFLLLLLLSYTNILAPLVDDCCEFKMFYFM